MTSMIRIVPVLAAILGLAAAAHPYGSDPPLTAELIVDGLDLPVSVTTPPDDPSRLYICGKRGRIDIFDQSSGTLLPTPFLDLTAQTSFGRERGLLDLRFDPNFVANRYVYVCYNRISDGATTVSRFTLSADPNVADPKTELVLTEVPQIQFAHNGGQIQFGPFDGYLYFAAGDASTAGDSDSLNNSQNLLVRAGKMLRIDPHAGPPYIPPGNPYIGNANALDEVWSSGLRNPWRFSFDRLTGDMYIGDVGRSEKEEVNFEPAGFAGGANYGWHCMEGTLCTGLSGCTCNDPSLTLPLLEIQQDNFGESDNTCAIIGGYVYRGTVMPEFAGRYFYMDYCGAWIRSFVVAPDGSGGHMVTDMRDHTSVVNPGLQIEWVSTMGEDADGELYFASIHQGTIWKLVIGLDCNGNGIADNVDIHDGTVEDCNGNGIPDPCDISQGPSGDLNGNGVPDECEDCDGNGMPDDLDIAGGAADENGNGILDECECPGDTNGDGFVNIDDIVNVVLDYGTDGSTWGGDANFDGIVNIDDIVLVVVEWGPCDGA